MSEVPSRKWPVAPVRPVHVTVEPTIDCNLRCPMCDRTTKTDYASHRDEGLSTAQWLELIDELAAMGVRQILVIGGGDPLMHPDIRVILERIAQYPITLHLWTNGTLITRRNVEWVANLPQILTISMDSAIEQVNDASRGVRGATQRTIRGLELLREQNRRPYTRIHSVISGISYRDIHMFLPLVERYRIDEFGGALIHPWDFVPDCMRFRNSEIGLRDDLLKAFAEQLSARGVALAGYFNQILQKGLERLAAKVPSPGGASRTRNTCYGLWSTATVRPNGDVSVCCYTYRPKLGSLRASSFAQVWLSAKAEGMRELVARGEYLDGPCKGCGFGSTEMNSVVASRDQNLLATLHDVIIASR
jgi:radical SAM protein with 4Fe4S-binding SPASM domain